MRSSHEHCVPCYGLTAPCLVGLVASRDRSSPIHVVLSEENFHRRGATSSRKKYPGQEEMKDGRCAGRKGIYTLFDAAGIFIRVYSGYFVKCNAVCEAFFMTQFFRLTRSRRSDTIGPVRLFLVWKNHSPCHP